jgi:hypothetical protein
MKLLGKKKELAINSHVQLKEANNSIKRINILILTIFESTTRHTQRHRHTPTYLAGQQAACREPLIQFAHHRGHTCCQQAPLGHCPTSTSLSECTCIPQYNKSFIIPQKASTYVIDICVNNVCLPVLDSIKRFFVGDIVHENKTHGSPVVGCRDGSVSLLASRVL